MTRDPAPLVFAATLLLFSGTASAQEASESADRAGLSVAGLIGFVVGSGDVSGFALGARGGYTFPFHVYVGGDFTVYAVSGGAVINIAAEGGYDFALTPNILLRPYAGFGAADDTVSGGAFLLYPGTELLYHVTSHIFLGGDVRVPIAFLPNTTSFTPGIGFVNSGGGTAAAFNLMFTGGYKF